MQPKLVSARLDVVVCVAPAVLPEGVTATPLLAEALVHRQLIVGRRIDGPADPAAGAFATITARL